MANVSSSNGLEKYPKLRFPGFEEPWVTKQFSDVFSFLSNNTLSRADLVSNGDIHNIHYGDVLIKYGSIIDVEYDDIPCIAHGRESKSTPYLHDGDVIIADTAEDETVGKCCEIININDAKIESGLHTIPCRPMLTFAPMFLGYYMNSYYYHKQLFPLMQGVKVLSISKGNIGGTLISLPHSYSEQKKIVDLLCLIDTRIRKQQQIIEALKKYKRGVIQQTFSGRKENDKVRFSKWKLSSFGEFFTEQSIRTSNCPDTPLVSLTVEDGITPKTERYYREFLITKQGDNYKAIKPSWFAYNPMNAHLGAIAPNHLGYTAAVSGYYNVFSVNEAKTISFWEEYLTSYPMLVHYKLIATGSLIEKQRVHYSQFVAIRRYLPSVEEQKRLSKLFEVINAKIVNARNIEHQLIRMRTFLLQKLFI